MKKLVELLKSAIAEAANAPISAQRRPSIESHLAATLSNAEAELKAQSAANPAPPPPPAGNTGAKVVAALILFVLALALPVQADSFNLTNTLAGAVNVTSWPTNTPGTNGLGVLTGGAISVANQDFTGFYFTGYNSTNTNCTVTVELIRSRKPAPPTGQADWEQSTAFPMTVSVTGSGYVYFVTNLPQWFIGPANWVGILRATNANAGGNGNITNVACGLDKKILPTRWP